MDNIKNSEDELLRLSNSLAAVIVERGGQCEVPTWPRLCQLHTLYGYVRILIHRKKAVLILTDFVGTDNWYGFDSYKQEFTYDQYGRAGKRDAVEAITTGFRRWLNQFYCLPATGELPEELASQPGSTKRILWLSSDHWVGGDVAEEGELVKLADWPDVPWLEPIRRALVRYDCVGVVFSRDGVRDCRFQLRGKSSEGGN